MGSASNTATIAGNQSGSGVYAASINGVPSWLLWAAALVALVAVGAWLVKRK